MTTKSEVVGNALNNNMQDALAVLINKAVGGIDAASGFLQEQIPDVIHQLLVWKMCEALLSTGIFLGLSVLFSIILRLIYKKHLKEQSKSCCEREDGWDVLLMGSGIFFFLFEIVTCIVVFSNISTALQIWLAPKVWLIEYAARLVK